jgi:Uma2 family endonuclease
MEVMATHSKPFLSFEQFLNIEADEEDGFRSEYEDGLVVPIEGATRNHSRIIINLSGMFLSGLRGTSCHPYTQDLMVQAGARRGYHPDLFVVCGKDLLLEGRNDVVLNPGLVIEVLSQSTEKRDRGVKLRNYQSIPSLREYWLVSQDQFLVEQYVREERGWLLRSWEEGAIQLSIADLSLPLADIYEDVSWER